MDVSLLSRDIEQEFTEIYEAYVVDEDMTDSMYLRFDDGNYPYNGPYLDISQ